MCLIYRKVVLASVQYSIVWSLPQESEAFRKTMWSVFASLLVITMIGSFAWGQAPSDRWEDVRKGRRLAFMLCIECHVVSPEQPYAPTLNPPAPSFQSIASRDSTNAASLRAFLTMTHQGMDRPKGMPHPGLADCQIEQITAYLLSLPK
jgi:hypothetical protein